MAVLPSKNHPIDCGEATTNQFARQFAKAQVSNTMADIDLVQTFSEIEEGTITTQTVGDTNYETINYPVSGSNFEVSVNFRPERFAAITSISSSNSSVLSQAENNSFLFEYESSGRASIVVRFSNNEQVAKKAIATTFEEPTVTNNFSSFVVGSLGRHIYDQIRNYANGTTSPPVHYPLYSTFTTNQYVKNEGSWAAGLNITGLSVNKTGSGNGIMFTAITPFHIIGAAHYAPSVGNVVQFLDSENQLIERTITDVEIPLFNPPNSPSGFITSGDCCVARLNSALPATVKKYKTLPSNFTNYFPLNINNNIMQLLPIVVSSHYRWDASWPLQRSNRYFYVYETGGLIQGLPPKKITYYPAVWQSNNFPNYSGIPSGIRGGDSGGPVFFVINGELVLVTCHTSSNGGAIHADFLSFIQGAINELGPSGQTYETVNLSGFTDFSS
jgi:hypothetical protein